MHVRSYYQFVLMLLLSFWMVACASVPASQNRTSEKTEAARQFLRSWDAGHVSYVAFKQSIEEDSEGQPGMVELTQRAFADVTAKDFEILLARVYARHLSLEHLNAVAQFTNKPTGNRFFREVMELTLAGQPVSGERLMRDFNADELTEILKFSQSEAFLAYQAALPQINRDLFEEGRQFGEERIHEYINSQ